MIIYSLIQVTHFISQRLVRVICPTCKTERTEKDAIASSFKNIKIYYGKGCENCKFIGYKGRIAIHEILIIDDNIQELVLSRASAAQIRKKARELGFKTLWDTGLEKIKQGITTPEEILRVTEWKE